MDEGPADRCALLACLYGGLACNFADEQVELGGAGTCVGAEDTRVERVGLGIKRCTSRYEAVMAAQLRGRQRRASEAERVLAIDIVEEAGGASHQHLHGTFGQD